MSLRVYSKPFLEILLHKFHTNISSYPLNTSTHIYSATFANQKKYMSLQDRLKSMLQSKTEEQENFLQENALKEGVITLPSGLQYLILKNGDGEKPGPTTMVTVHYEGSLVNGNVFDSSYKRGKPATFGVHQVIAGWTEALQLMPVGSKWKLFRKFNPVTEQTDYKRPDNLRPESLQLSPVEENYTA